ncbi:hypothetical protein PSEEN2408 [Pseudomonas entomophila L48]|uniref:Uncharacterized protein n=1 Tax=Pseudomonas entomophila (strain L48) TaxID=384676 RepID=Q1IAV1_PSEE4|nr:hypothetical protein PSEEN2408 [Pseudomonas entomophila L48]
MNALHDRPIKSYDDMIGPLYHASLIDDTNQLFIKYDWTLLYVLHSLLFRQISNTAVT